MFTPIRYDSGDLDTLLTASSTTIAKGDALKFTSGYVERATSSNSEILCVAMEDKVTAGGAHESILVLWTNRGAEFEADTAGNPAQTTVGTKIDLTDHDTANEAASSNDVFFVKALVGATTDNKVRGYFVMKTS